MPKKKSSAKRADDKGVSFEEALGKLHQTVQQLEDGQLGLTESLASYEQGVKFLRKCYQLLEQAERKIELLSGVDTDGNEITEPFDDESLSLEEKAKSRSRRRSGAETSDSAGEVDVDSQKGLF